MSSTPSKKEARCATLLDILIDGFEKNEMLDGFHWRQLPLGTDGEAERKFSELLAEATRWKGKPQRTSSRGSRQLATWDDLELRRAGRGILVLARAPRFDDWWHEPATWADDAMGPAFAWLHEDRDG